MKNCRLSWTSLPIKEFLECTAEFGKKAATGIEDHNSSRGTRVNGLEIKGRGKQKLRTNDVITAGLTTLQVDFSEGKVLAPQTNYLENGALLLPERPYTQSGVAIAKDVDATAVEAVPLVARAGDATAQQLKMVCDLPFHFATKTTLETLLPAMVDRLVEVVPNGESSALVLRDPETDALLLKAYRYVQHTYLSESLLRRAMVERKAFVWKKRP